MRNFFGSRLARFISVSPLSMLLFGVWIASLFIMGACANIGTPSGGPRDEDPPIFVSANPPMGAVDVNKRKIVLTFNELVNVKDAFQKVVVSPTAKAVPRVSSLGKRVTIEFDSLQANTTYTIDFADAIEDNNESNKLRGFAYTFSTGSQLDSLRISGRVMGARNMEPQQSILVGVMSNLADSAFKKQRLLRVAKTDDRGQFTIRGLAPGEYRVFALKDLDNDYKYSSPEEDLAFYGVTVSPYTESTVANDTIYNVLTGEVDTVINRGRTRFLPNDILLRTFNSELRNQYLAKYERLDSTRIFMKFNTKASQLPHLEVVGHPEIRSLGRLEASQTLDSLIYWLTPELMRTDSLTIAATYLRTDSTSNLSLFTDTLRFFTKKPNVKPAGKSKDTKIKKISAADSIAAITTVFTPASSSQDVYLPLKFTTKAPLEKFDTTAVHLSVMVDSAYVSVKEPFRVANPDSLSPLTFLVDYPWEYGMKYRLDIDTIAGTDIYGLPTRPLKHEFTAKEASEYCSLLFHITGIPNGVPGFVELLNSSDAVQRVAIVKDGEAYFPFLAPGKYYARYIEDVNGNGEYDTGNYDLQLQPEVAYYYPKAINIKKNWDKEEKWALFDVAVDQMKPQAILKNKPEAPKRGKKNTKDNLNEDEEDEQFDPNSNPFDPNDKQRRNKKHTLR